jgi:hypothetical protein
MRGCILILFVLLTSCTAQQRINRIISRHPKLVINDTVKYSRLVIYPSRMARLNLPDSVLNRLQPGDSVMVVSKKGITLILRRKNQETDIVASIASDTINVDTMFVISPIKVVRDENVDRRQKNIKMFIKAWWGFLIVIIMIFLYKLIRIIGGN